MSSKENIESTTAEELVVERIELDFFEVFDGLCPHSLQQRPAAPVA